MIDVNPSITGWLASIEMSANPACSRAATYSVRVRAPLTQSTQLSGSSVSTPGRSASAATSAMARRPQAGETRIASPRTRPLSTANAITQLDRTTSTLASGKGMASRWPLRNSTLVRPASS